MAGEGGKKSDPTVPIIIGIGVLLLIVLFGGCNGINLPVYNGGGNYNGSQYNGCDQNHRWNCGNGCDQYHRWNCRDGRGRDDEDRRGDHDRRHHPRATETPEATSR